MTLLYTCRRCGGSFGSPNHPCKGHGTDPQLDIMEKLRRLRDEDVEPSNHTRDVADEAFKEIERLREIEWMYKGLCK